MKILFTTLLFLFSLTVFAESKSFAQSAEDSRLSIQKLTELDSEYRQEKTCPSSKINIQTLKKICKMGFKNGSYNKTSDQLRVYFNRNGGTVTGQYCGYNEEQKSISSGKIQLDRMKWFSDSQSVKVIVEAGENNSVQYSLDYDGIWRSGVAGLASAYRPLFFIEIFPGIVVACDSGGNPFSLESPNGSTVAEAIYYLDDTPKLGFSEEINKMNSLPEESQWMSPFLENLIISP